MTAFPLITTIDWIIARCSTGVNVMNDMLIAILLERWEFHKGLRIYTLPH